MIHQLLPCVDSQFMVSFDITSLLSNIPLDEVISICADFLYWSPLTSESVFMELVTIMAVMLPFTLTPTHIR